MLRKMHYRMKYSYSVGYMVILFGVLAIMFVTLSVASKIKYYFK